MNPDALTVLELQNRLADEPKAVVIDVRTPVEFAEVHADRAVNLPLDRLNLASLTQVGCTRLDKPVYLLCRSGQRAAKAAEKLQTAGYTHPVVITGGTLAWIEAGLPVTRGTAKIISLERQVRIAAGAMVLSGALLAHFVHPGFVWLAGFVGAGLMFAGITDFCGMGLLLAKLPWNQRVQPTSCAQKPL
jgi:rhodanese-related sulfurtransferase